MLTPCTWPLNCSCFLRRYARRARPLPKGAREVGRAACFAVFSAGSVEHGRRTAALRANYVLVAHPSLPVRTVGDLLQLAKARPGQLTWAAGGGVPQLAAELFKSTAGIDVVIVPYKGNAPAVTATMAGEVSLIFGGIAQSARLMEAGRLRALAVSGARHSPALPNVPTLMESGVPDFEAGSRYGILAPAGTLKEIVNRLNREVVRVLQLPDLRERLLAEAFDVPLDTPEQFAAHIKADVPRWAKVVRDAGIKPN
jgi:tripartite-type tricarboxylate transporter receptor subunit TctC